MPVSQVEQVAVDKLRPHPLNVHAHSRKQIAQINKIIEQVGFINPIAANETGQILAGHGRWLAAKLRGLRTVPVITVSGLSETLQRAYILADNKLTENAGWDRAGLALELNQLTPLLEEIGLDIGLTGFEPAEIDGLLGDLVDPECDPADEVPFPQQHSRQRVSVTFGSLDPIACSAATPRSTMDVRKLMGGERAAMVFTDPPYNVPIVFRSGPRPHQASRVRVRLRRDVAA